MQYGIARRNPPDRRLLITAVAVLFGTTSALEARATAPELPPSVIHSFALPFLVYQLPDGNYQLPPSVQRHLKAEIAMSLAADATKTRAYAESARRDIEWVIANHLETDGGLNWNGPEDVQFFEVHQHWFLIASEMIRRQVDGPPGIQATQRAAWKYLVAKNQASADFYVHNQDHHGAFFAYRSVDRDGQFMTQAPFKGSYEVGAALWSFALHSGSSWLDEGADDGGYGTIASYLDRLVPQIVQRPDDHGFYDPEQGTWIRALTWTGDGWSGWEPQDWKYTLHMEEGALLLELLAGDGRLHAEARKNLDHLLSSVTESGYIESIPDGNGSFTYEYGEALSVLGIGAVVFRGEEIDLALRCLDAGLRVANFVAQNCDPLSSEDAAMVLAGLARVYEAQIDRDIAGAAEDRTLVGPITLEIWPNPISGNASFHYRAVPGEPAALRIIDSTGRELFSSPLAGTEDGTGVVAWDGRDMQLRPLPSGRYEAVLESGWRRRIAGITILR